MLCAICGFAEGIRGLPWWYQLVSAIAAVLTLLFLFIVYQTDPGVIPCSATKGKGLSVLGCWPPVNGIMMLCSMHGQPSLMEHVCVQIRLLQP